jgi:hypothetical protein
MRIQSDMIYLGDNGRALCGDLSGQSIMAVTPDVAAEAEAEGWTVKCEQCGKPASRLHHV